LSIRADMTGDKISMIRKLRQGFHRSGHAWYFLKS